MTLGIRAMQWYVKSIGNYIRTRSTTTHGQIQSVQDRIATRTTDLNSRAERSETRTRLYHQVLV